MAFVLLRLHGGLAAAALGSALAAPHSTLAQTEPAMLQWFEARWEHVERRMPDFFLAGYGSTWLPSPCKAASSGSTGYDVFDRFDLGSPASPTAFGTEQFFRAMVGEFHAAGAQVYIDTIMNHNSFRRGDVPFQSDGGYPGFWMAPASPPRTKAPQDDWGDFHNGTSGGYYQSENPGGPRYDLHRGDLVALIDIAQESNHQFIRHPVAPGNPLNIPAGTQRNLPDAANARFYPDRQLAPTVVNNPGTPRNPGAQQFTIYPFNTADPLAGDPVADNTTGLLMRWTQWMCDEFGVDGFRLDAAKHIPSWFWDRYWDSAVHRRRRTPGGSPVTPFSFVESVESNGFTYANYVRKDGFADRDALDLNGAGQLRDLLNAAGLGSWQSVLAAHIDNADDGLNNGTLGVNHVFSHDNGSAGDGSSQPPLPTLRRQGLTPHAYLLLRPGTPVVYHNARAISRSGGFWPREGVPLALGLDPAANAPNPAVTRLAAIRGMVGRGEFNPLNGTDPVNPSLADVLVFERRRNNGGGQFSANCLVAVNDRYDAGVQTRSVLTAFPPGTRLHELTGNAADPGVDPAGQVPEVLVVDGSRRVTVTVPNNRSAAGEHHRGYVVYAPALPAGEVSFTNASGSIAPDPSNAPAHLRRLNAVPVISADSFEVRLTTMPADPHDPDTDDNALFRFGPGYDDANGNGTIDFPEGSGVASGYEQFLTERRPLFGSGQSRGLYRQAIDATRMADGYHYLSVIAFKRRPAGTDPLFREFRAVIYLDRAGPPVELLNPTRTITSPSHEFAISALDRTATRVHLLLDLPPGQDPVPLATIFNQAARRDRFDWRFTAHDLRHGRHAVTLVAFEVTGNARAVRSENIYVDTCAADFDDSGTLDIFDFLAFQNAFDLGLASACDFDTSTGPLTCDVFDFLAFQNAYEEGCR